MNEYGNAPVSVEKKSIINDLVNEIIQNESALSKALDDLSEKLKPVSNPTQTGGDKDSQEMMGVYSPIAKSLQEIAEYQRKDLRRIRFITSNIEL